MKEERMDGKKTLICKEDLLDTVLDHFGVDLAYLGKDLQFCQEAIAMAPAVDAVEVVYCKDCARCKKGYCTIRKDSWGATLMVGQHDFCSDGERRNDG